MHWKPMDDFCIRFSDKTAEERTEEQLDEMIDRINKIANEYDFGILTYSNWPNMRKIAVNEERILKDNESPKTKIYLSESTNELNKRALGLKND